MNDGKSAMRVLHTLRLVKFFRRRTAGYINNQTATVSKRTRDFISAASSAAHFEITCRSGDAMYDIGFVLIYAYFDAFLLAVFWGPRSIFSLFCWCGS